MTGEKTQSLEGYGNEGELGTGCFTEIFFPPIAMFIHSSMGS